MGESGEPVTDIPLSEECEAELEQLDKWELRAVVDHAQELLRQSHPQIEERISVAEGEELVRKVDHDGYVEVVKAEPCGTGCPDCPHGPYLYHVSEEVDMDGEPRLHWTYLGRVRS